MKMHRLPDGTEIPESAYIAVMVQVRDLNLTELLEAVDLARDPAYKIRSKDTEKTLHDKKIIGPDGRMHDVVREILRNMK